jgi:hypothetical protein
MWHCGKNEVAPPAGTSIASAGAEDSMKIGTFSGVVLALCALAIAPGHAAANKPAHAAVNKGKSGAPPKTTHGAGSTTRAPKTAVTHGKAPTTRPAKSAPTTTTTKTHGRSHATDTKPSKTTTTDTKRSGTTAVAPTNTPTTSDTDTGTTPPNPIAAKLQNEPLGTRIEGMLPKGMTLDTASAGFKNQGQFIAAVHVSQNLGIPFVDLKATMLGTSLPGSTTADTTSPMSLGQAIQRLKPFANATTEATRAETQATHDLQTSSTPTTSTTTTPTSTKKARTRGK